MFTPAHEAHAAAMRARKRKRKRPTVPVVHKPHPRRVRTSQPSPNLSRLKCICGRCDTCLRRAAIADREERKRKARWVHGLELVAPAAPITTALMCADYGELFGLP